MCYPSHMDQYFKNPLLSYDYCECHCYPLNLSEMFFINSSESCALQDLKLPHWHMQLYLISNLFSIVSLSVFNQAKMSSLLLAEMTSTLIRMKKKDLSFHVGPEGRSPHSFNKSSWMEERALFFLGTKNTEQFTRKRCCITLIETKKDKNLNISQEFPQRYPPKAKKVEQKTRICQEKAMIDIRWNINISYVILFRGIPWNIPRVMRFSMHTNL